MTLPEKSNTLHAIMLRHMAEVLKKHRGNRTQTARELGVTTKCVRNWIKKYEELSEFREG